MHKNYSKATLAIAAKIAASVFDTLAKADIAMNVDQAQEAIEAAHEIIDDYMKKAFNKFGGQSSECQNTRESNNEEISKACEKIDAIFHRVSMAELALAKAEDREVSEKYLKRMAVRITRSVMKGIKGVDVSDITSDIKRRKDGTYLVSITIASDHE